MANPEPSAACTFEIASASRYFEGHFPGDSILPGAALLQLVLGRMADAAEAEVIGLPRVRFLQPVRPGARLTMTTERAGDQVAVAIAQAGQAAATITLTTRPIETRSAGMPALELPPVLAPAALPHEGPAILLRRQLAADADALLARALVPATSAFADAAWASLAWIEAAAQATAAHSALRAALANPMAPARAVRGMLVGVKNVRLARRLRFDIECSVAVQRVGGNGPLSIYAARVFDVDQELMRGELSVWTQSGDLRE